MPHKTFVIERFAGEAKNQKSRITKSPTRIIGDFDRVGGISPLPRITTHSYAYYDYGRDWTGVTAWRDPANISQYASLGYGQSGSYVTADASDLLSHINFFWPGAGWGTLPRDDGTELFYVDTGGMAHYYTAPTASLSMSGLSSGSLTSHDRVFAAVIYFIPAAHGLIPVAAVFDSFPVGSYNGVRVIITPPTLPPGALMNVYIGIRNTKRILVEWDRVYSGAPYDWEGYVDVENVDDFSSNSTIVVYGGSAISWPDTYTYAFNRSFFANIGASVFNLRIGWPTANDVSWCPINTVDRHTGQFVYFSDPGFIGFSDTYTEHRAQFIRFDDRIWAITPSVRGIYAFSKLGTWEAFGDFATSSGTKVTLIPVLGGVDDPRSKTAFSGDTAFFVKEGFIHQMGAGGVEQIGKPMHLHNFPIEAIWYDRFRRRLYVSFVEGDSLVITNRRVVAQYDPNTKQWGEIISFDGQIATGMHSILPYDENIFYCCGRRVSFSTIPGLTLTGPEFVFEKLDMGEPGVRKRVHQVLVSYVGEYTSVEAQIAPHGGTMRDCTVNDRGGYFDIRCPTVSARAIDFRMAATTTDRDFSFNPPLVFYYTPYGGTVSDA